MFWNWQLADWPKFTYDPDSIGPQERQFLLELGSASAFLKNIGEQEYNQFIVEILSQEGEESSKIEGETLDRASLQSSIKKHFGIQTAERKQDKKEAAMAELICSVY